jgi:hypothetical protein
VSAAFTKEIAPCMQASECRSRADSCVRDASCFDGLATAAKDGDMRSFQNSGTLASSLNSCLNGCQADVPGQCFATTDTSGFEQCTSCQSTCRNSCERRRERRAETCVVGEQCYRGSWGQVQKVMEGTQSETTVSGGVPEVRL